MSAPPLRGRATVTMMSSLRSLIDAPLDATDTPELSEAHQ
jgi:hypothetical protein